MLNGRMAAANDRVAVIIRASSAGSAQVAIGWSASASSVQRPRGHRRTRRLRDRPALPGRVKSSTGVVNDSGVGTRSRQASRVLSGGRGRMTGMTVTGRLELAAIDATDIVGLASFYAELTG